MTYSVLVRSSAERDIEHALDWYAEHAPEQVDRFVDELAAVVERIKDYPRSFRPLRREARRAPLRVFPYLLWYRCLDEVEIIEILALVHGRQDTGQLQDRLP